jgi:hypothetical protein
MSVLGQSVRLHEVARGPVVRRLEAEPQERRQLADRLGVDSLQQLSAEVRAASWLDGAEVEGTWTAIVGQTCGVTLEPLENRLAGRFTVRAVPRGSVNAPAEELEVAVDPDAPDPPDVLEDDVLDLTAYLLEHVALEVDPFPRKPGAVFEAPEPESPPSPFAVLDRLKER